MNFFIFAIFCNFLSSGQLQETNHVDEHQILPPKAAKNVEGDWQTVHTIQGNFYGQAQRNVLSKPCSRRSNSEDEPINQLPSPIFPSKINKPLSIDNTHTLMPQALRNGIPKNQDLVPTSPLNNDINDVYKTRNSLKISNPIIDSLEEIQPEILLPSKNKETHKDNTKPQIKLRSEPSSDSHSVPSSELRSAGSRDNSAPKKPTVFVPNNVHDAKLDDQYILPPGKVIDSVPNDFFPALNNDFNSDPSTEFLIAPTDNILSEPSKLPSVRKAKETASVAPDKCSHSKEPDDLVGHSRRSMSSYDDDDDDDSSRNSNSDDKELVENKNNPYTVSRIDNEHAMASVLNEAPNTSKSSKDQNLRSLDKSKTPTQEKSLSHVGRSQFNDARREMIEPTRGAASMSQSPLMLIQTERICYACSTANNPTCWSPDRRTTVKYCRRGNNACLTKTFGSGSTFTLIRDCGKSCDDSEMGGLMPRYKSCSMCHSELCNGAYSINGNSIIFTLLLIALIKYFN